MIRLLAILLLASGCAPNIKVNPFQGKLYLIEPSKRHLYREKEEIACDDAKVKEMICMRGDDLNSFLERFVLKYGEVD